MNRSQVIFQMINFPNEIHRHRSGRRFPRRWRPQQNRDRSRRYATSAGSSCEDERNDRMNRRWQREMTRIAMKAIPFSSKCCCLSVPFQPNAKMRVNHSPLSSIISEERNVRDQREVKVDGTSGEITEMPGKHPRAKEI